MKKLTFVAGAFLAVAALGAQAHARLKASNPKEGAVVTEMQMPAVVSLTFSESARMTAVSIQKDQEPKKKLTPPTATGQQIDVAVPTLSPGAYTLSWRVASTDDNHIMPGELHFKVTAGRLNRPMKD
ncbi:MAG TPA: copper resistance CopC family protein [Steroidobacteraceae bacterium]|nr:copper resistance CopC family protein [Steroidobacteraceae bacterium]